MAAKRKKTDKFYMGNPNLPVKDSAFEWTEEMISEVEKCKEDVIYFGENYFYVLNLDEGRIKIPLYDAQKRILNGIKDNRFFVLLASRQIGKCVVRDTLIKVRDKNTKEIKEILISEFYDSIKS